MATNKLAPGTVTLAEYQRGITEIHDNHQLFVNKIADLAIREKQMKYAGLEVVYREIDIENPCILEVVHPAGLLKLQFELMGHSEFTPSKNTPSSIPVLIPCGQFNGIYMPRIAGQLYYPHSRKCLDVTMTLDYLHRVLGPQTRVIADFLSQVARRQPCLLHKRAQRITVEMHRCINEIIRPSVSAHLQPLFISNKLDELILLIADDISRQTNPLSALDNLDDRGNILRLKQWIAEHVTDPITLSQLAAIAGMSTSKLKTVFRSSAGLPVMTYVRQQKMEFAYHLLFAQQYTVGEVAAMVNYQHTQHFTAAFKRTFGKLPSEVAYQRAV